MTNQNMTTKTSDIRIASKELPEKEFNSKIKSLHQSTNELSRYPVVIDEEYMNNAKKIGHIINSVVVMFAYNYTRDEKLQQLYQLDQELNEIIKMAEGIPFELGMYRLNFLYDSNGQPRISEVNCQDPTKNWFLSADLSQITNELAGKINKDWSGIEDQSEFITELENLFEQDEVLYIVKKEKKSEKETLLNELTNKGINVAYVQPEDFSVVNGDLKIGTVPARQFFLEMSAEELKSFDAEVLQKIIQSGRCINDVRSIILVHNKKLMAGLFNPNIMGSYINSEDFEFLKSYLIPSFVLNGQADIDYLNNSQDNWRLKNSSSRDGEGMYVRSNYSPEDWNQLLLENWQDFLVQPVIQQKEFQLSIDHENTPVNLIGMELYFNAKSYGSGFFRASKEINTLDYKDILKLPCIVEKIS